MGLGLSRENDDPMGGVFTVRGRLYRYLQVIGQGSEATVYRCEDQSATQHAVKVFDFSRYYPREIPARVKNFRKEAKILQFMSKRSRHFIYLLDYEYNPILNVGYMIMELGQNSLRDYLGGVPMNDVPRRMIWKQIVTILRDLQTANIVHADIKPDNMIFVNNVLKVTDLGLAFRLSSLRPTVIRPRVRGTLDYMAPEVFRHQTGFKSDIWSSGIILYEMVYGRPPYFNIDDRHAKAAAITAMEPFPIPPTGDQYLSDCLHRCLHFDFRRRPSAFQLVSHPYTRM